MPVAVEDGLTGRLAVVDDQVQAIRPGRGLDRSGQARDKACSLGGKFFREVGEVRVMGLGHEEDVASIDRIDVEEGQSVAGLEHLG